RASRRRSRAGEPHARGVVVLTLARRKPNAVLEDDQVAGEVARWSHWFRAGKESLLDVKHRRDGATITSNGNDDQCKPYVKTVGHCRGQWNHLCCLTCRATLRLWNRSFTHVWPG